MLALSVSVMDLYTGSEFWITLPASNIKSAIRGLDLSDVIISDTDENIPFELGFDIAKINETLLKCEDAGITSVDEVAALMNAVGADAITDEQFVQVVEDGGFRQFTFRFTPDTIMLSNEQYAARWLATEQYIPFGNLDIGDLVPVEDKLIDYIDWDEVWDDYASKGFFVEGRNDQLIVTQTYI